ncbi:MAG: asparagine synthase C-terminal domain-containing protein [Bacteroidetes bacterium]|nr:asparagine synthase C-terminal domain-containing protein [Bacteroidota bacterium]
MIIYKLFGNQAYQWECKDNHYFTGYFFDENNDIHNGKEAIDFLVNIEKHHAVTPKFNGIYTCIITSANGISIISDTINYFPVFYLKQNDNWIISDDWNYLVKLKKGITANLEAQTEFQSIGFVLDNETLDKEIFKTRAGEMLLLNNDGTEKRIHDYNFLPENFLNDTFQKLSSEIISEFYEAGKRLIKFLNSRTAVLPLSGGFDSRLIACILKKLNYENVICFTYGVKNREEEISRRVAQNLGYKWFFIDYEEIELETYIDDDEFLNYMKSVGNGYSMPYLQEYFAVKKLRKEHFIPENSIFLPGHVGDNIAGSYVLKSIKTKTQNDKLPNRLIDTYFFFNKMNKKEKKYLKCRISKTLKDYPVKNCYSKKYNPYIEDWCVKEKFSKFLFHSSKVFDFWGYETYFLLWDKKIVNFFRNLPYEFRENKWLYDAVAINEFFKKLNVYFHDEEMKVTPLDIKIQKIKNKLRDFFPSNYLLKKMKKHDWMYYSTFTSVMEDRLEKKEYKRLKKFRSFNAIICRWYMDYVGFSIR